MGNRWTTARVALVGHLHPTLKSIAKVTTARTIMGSNVSPLAATPDAGVVVPQANAHKPRQIRHPEYYWLYATLLVVCVELAAHVLSAVGWRPTLVRSLVGLSPWLLLSAIFLALYQGTAQRLAQRVEHVLPHWGAHIALVAIVALGAGAGLHALLVAMHYSAPRWSSFLAECVVTSWIVVLPSYAIERARLRERETLQRLEAAERTALDAQLRALQAQTNPHFLFNSLNVVAGLIHEDPALAERTLERFASLFRYTIEGAKASRVTLDRELAFVEDYLEVQRLRFGDRLTSVIHADASVLSTDVPPLCLQPLVENAVLHGLSTGQPLRVEVSMTRELGGVRVVVRDDGPGLGGSSHHGTRTSIDALRARIAAIPGATFWMRDRAPRGCEASVFFPGGA